VLIREKKGGLIYAPAFWVEKVGGQRRQNFNLMVLLHFSCVLVVHAPEWIAPAAWIAELPVFRKLPTFALKWLSGFWGYIVRTGHRGVE